MNKPIKPEITIPESFAENGIKTDFTAEQIQNGFDNLRPEVLNGDNLNKFIDDTYKGLNYSMAAADAVNLINEDEILTVKDGQFVSTKNVGGYRPPLLQPFWSDHILHRVDSLRADTFSWQSGKIYEAVYDELVSEYDDENSVEETEGEITFKRTPKGYKIADSTQETAILNKYNKYGIAWYYILDKDNTQFKLPRTKFGFEGLRDKVGDQIQAGLPNIKSGSWSGVLSEYDSTETDYSAVRRTSTQTNGNVGTGYTRASYDFNASRSNPIYGNSDTVQERATQMYLYFYVGNYTQTAIEQTAGLNAELFNNKADKTEIDGEWVMLPETIVLLQDISLNNTSYIPVSIDLTAFLPNDNYNYEILLSADMLTNTSSGNSGQCNVCVNEDCKNLVGICGEITRTSNSAYARGSAILPLQNNSRTVYLQRANYHATLVSLHLNAYRRLGKIGV